jgi:hypothetical protein
VLSGVDDACSRDDQRMAERERITSSKENR